MKSVLSIKDFLEFLLEGLSQRDLKYVVSHNAFGCRIGEVFITEARELVMISEELLEENTIRWILEIRTPLSMRLTIFTHNVPEYKLRVTRAISELLKDGIDIPNIEHVVSVQELSYENIQRLLDSLENWRDLVIGSKSCSSFAQKIKFRETTLSSFEPPSFTHSLTKRQGNSVHDVTSGDISNDSVDYQSLHISLRNAIKTYWTEQYLARFLKTTPEKARAIACRIGVSRELCGREVPISLRERRH